ncbi:MAG TPA: RDD family protein [Thermoanaerobaculia bacterium]|nr:RDD family protein [Thermoanaerobaculia bacterium]
MRFDEVELETVPVLEDVAPDDEAPSDHAPRFRRLLALLTDLSLFAALVLALTPLLPQPASWMHHASLAGFVLVLSYYYFVGTWMLWGKTIGGAIFDVRVIRDDAGAVSLRDASMRFAGFLLSLATCGLGFLFGVPNRMSDTHCVSA